MNTTLPAAKPLSPERVAYYKGKMIPNGLPVRFMVNGCPVASIQTGKCNPKGSNVMHQPVYWNFSKETSKELAKEIGATPIFDKED